MADNKWTLISGLTSTVKDIVCTVLNKKKEEDRDLDLNVRVSLLEKRCKDLEDKLEKITGSIS